ncbi:VWA domain-containing protein [Bacillus sp. FJAT-50079]|uniref:vWA domain-containing protein n=1 Tax=Bacillus sp. FJAT-50079 TaxID=2833577 RepID=UPI001BC9C9B2|nr:VWA domain-containing protein [Bacillus sp. FJAT-50079]MBS4207545.1 VWA domain-containing protein [Bacillus sp. FJAT-50079]
MKIRNLFLCLSIFFILAGCGGKETADEKGTLSNEAIELAESKETNTEQQDEMIDDEDMIKDEEKDSEEVVVQPLPQTLAELAERLPGKTEYVGILREEEQKEMDELTKHLPDISGEPSKQQLDAYYSELLAIFQQDFHGPEELIASLRFQAIGSPDIDNPRMQFKENLNVLVLLDASGSMNANLGGQTQMEAAKTAITNFMKELPIDTNVGLRIYGHEGTGSDADKQLSCSSSELVYPLTPYTQADFQAALDKIKPAGWTPIQLALNEAEKDLAPFKGEENTNIVYLVSDGISTCDDDPVTAAKSLYNSDITPIVNVIGFNIDHEGQKQLKEVAKATEGSYRDVQNAETLQDELNQASEVAKKWEDWKKKQGVSLEHDRIRNWLAIFGYDTDEERKWIDERQQVGFALQYLQQDKKLMSQESRQYLANKNREYHDWIEAEYKKLKAELHALNDGQINDAIQMLEEKYRDNAPE